jgi:hypothetical protein
MVPSCAGAGGSAGLAARPRSEKQNNNAKATPELIDRNLRM